MLMSGVRLLAQAQAAELRLAATAAAARRSAARSAPAARGEPQRDYSLVPVPPKPVGALRALSEAIVSALHNLIVLATRVRHASANERYVRSYLESLGLDAYQLDVLAQTRPSAFRLSVAREIEPAVQALRSMGLTGSALASVVARAPGVLARAPEAHALPLCAALRALLGSNGVGALVRYPPLAELDAEQLEAAARALSGPGGDRRAAAAFLWARPAAFERLARALPPPAGGAGLFGLYSAHRRRAGEADAALEALRAATARAAAAAGGGGAAEADAFADVERALEALDALDGGGGEGDGASAPR